MTTLSARVGLESPLNLACMFLAAGRKLEYLERSPACTEENMQTPHRKAPDDIQTVSWQC